MQNSTDLRKKLVHESSTNDSTKIRSGSINPENSQISESEHKKLMDMPIKDLLQYFPYPPSQIPSVNSIRIFKARGITTSSASSPLDSIDSSDDSESVSTQSSSEFKPTLKVPSGNFAPLYSAPKRGSRGTTFTASSDTIGGDSDLDLNTMELVLRGCKGVLGTKEEKQFLKFLTDNDEELVQKYQVRAHQILADRLTNPLLLKSKEKFKTMLNNMTRNDKNPNEEKGPPFSLNKFSLTFNLGNDAVLPLHTTMSEKIILTNKLIPKAKFVISPISPPESTYTLAVNPSTGIIKKKQYKRLPLKCMQKLQFT